MKLYCTECGREYPEGEYFCLDCGLPLVAKAEYTQCADCGTQIPLGEELCSNCKEHRHKQELQNKAYEEYKKGEDCVANQDEACFAHFKRAVELGDVKPAYFWLGFCYSAGIGCPQDDELAFSYFMKGHESGDFKSTFRLGNCYLNGNGVKEDTKLAFKYFKQAADNKCYLAYGDLGLCYFFGEGTDESPKLAFKYLYDAFFDPQVQFHMPIAIFVLGYCYYYGKGCAKDESKGRQLIRKAADLGDESAIEWCKENL